MNLLTNLPKRVSAVVVSDAYRQRWTIEGGFLDLTTTLDCEINTLCYPRAALLVFCVALLAYNLHSTIKGVMRSEHGAEKVETDLSRYFVSSEIGQVYRGMMVALPPEEWVGFRDLPLQEYIAFLKKLASKVDFADTPKRIGAPRKQRPNAITIRSIPISRSPRYYWPENSRKPVENKYRNTPWKG